MFVKRVGQEMIVTDLSQSFHPVPKESCRKDKRKTESSRIKQKVVN